MYSIDDADCKENTMARFRSPSLTLEQELQIVEKYKTGQYTCSSLGREFGRVKSTINNCLKKHNILVLNDARKLSRKYTLNEEFFDIIDTEAKAYFLGLLYADGSNNEKEI